MVIGKPIATIMMKNDEHERDAAWDDVYITFPDADYIEEF